MPRNAVIFVFGFIENLLRFLGMCNDNVWFISKNLKWIIYFFSFYPYALFECLKKEESRVKGGRIIQLPYLEFFKEGGEGLGGVSTTSNPSFLIPLNWRDLKGE